MKKQKILFLTLDITIPGGIERVISNIASYYAQIDKYGVEIISVFHKNNKPFYPLPPNTNITYLSYKEYNLTSLGNKILSHLVLVKCILTLRIPRNSILVSTTTNISIYVSIFRKKRNLFKLVAAEHGYFYAFSPFTRLIRKFAFKFVDVVITLTNSEKENYTNFAKKVIVIPNSLSFFPNTSCNYQAKRVLAAGRLVKEKGFDKLLKIYQILGKKYQDWEFILYGSQDYLIQNITNAAKQCPQNVKVLPATLKLQEELLKSSIYVCTSSSEAFPMVMLEAMACGLTIVSFDCPPGPQEIITHKKDGILVPLNNIQQMIKEIETLINNAHLRRSYGLYARKSMERFLPEKIFKKWNNLFDSLC